MPHLVLMYNREIDIPRLDPRRSLHELSPKQIAKGVEDALRKQCACKNVQLLSEPTLSQGRIWTGTCRIGETEYRYRLMRSIYD